MSRMFSILIVTIILVVILSWVISFNTRNCKLLPNISEIETTLYETKKGIRGMLIPEFKKVFDANVRENPKNISRCLQAHMGDRANDLDLSGYETDEAIKRLYYGDREVYNILARCRFLDLMGKLISTIGWLLLHSKSTPGQMQDMYDNLKKVDMTNINTWVNPGNSRSAIGRVIAGV